MGFLNLFTYLLWTCLVSCIHTWQAHAVGSEGALPGSTEGHFPGFIPRYLEGQSAVTIKHVSCGDLFTACLTGKFNNTPKNQRLYHTNPFSTLLV